MSDSALQFRVLEASDIPAVLSLCQKIWNGEDYIPTTIDSWIQKSEELSSYTYGAFKKFPLLGETLIALGRIRFLSSELAWLEGGRVDPQFQKQGIGIQLAQHALDYARMHGYQYAQYDTWSQNHGSIAIAHHLGFFQKTYVECLDIPISSLQLPFCNISHADLIYLFPENVYHAYKNIPNGPGSEINIGWAYRPCLPQFFVAMASGSKWIQYQQAIAHQISSQFTESNEKPNSSSIWITFYGDFQDVRTLCIYLFHQIIDDPSFQSINIFCPEPLSSIFLSLGASYIENIKSGVLLFEKDL